jgi:hypothetical protein
MDWIFVIFALALGILALVYVGFFVYRLLGVPEAGPRLRSFTRFFVGLILLIVAVSIIVGLVASTPISDWGAVVAASAITLLLLVVAVLGFSIGFRQMDEDGIGYLRFFQLGSSIILTLAIAPAFFAFVTYSTKLS